MPSALTLALAAIVTATSPITARAQVLGGTLVEEGTESPVVGALMVALDSTGTARGRTLTRADGTFLLRLPVAGTYAVEVQRIGIRSQTSRAVVVPPDEPAYLRIEARQEAVALEGISVTTGRRCRVREQAGEDVARVWDEVRKALETAVVAGEERLLTYEIERFERTLDADDMRVVDGSSSRRTVRAEQPFGSIDAEQLREGGFVQSDGEGRSFYAPDADVLLSSAFLDTHCLRLADADDPSRIAVEFEPVPGRTVPDIEGRMVVDRASAVLEALEFRYVRSPSPAGEGVEGGSIRFVRAPNGVWVPADWRIRMTSGVRSGGRLGDREVEGMVLSELKEVGGRVLGVSDPEGGRWRMSGSATLTGVVARAGGGVPMSGARVRVEGTAYATVADEEGRYRLTGLAAGRYAIRAWHPVLDSLPWPDEPTTTVEIAEGEEVRADVTVPTDREVLRGRCEGRTVGGDEALEPEPRVVYGVVRNASGAALSGADVIASWERWGLTGAAAARTRTTRNQGATIVTNEGFEAQVETDRAGRFVICGLPDEADLSLRAVIGDLAGEEAVVEGEVRVGRVDLVVGPSDPGTRPRGPS